MSDSRSVAEKLFAILDAVRASKSSRASLSRIASKADLPVSTAHRLIAEWVNWGGLVRASDGNYEIGTKLWETGVISPSISRLRQAAMPFLEDLVNATKQHSQLAILEGVDALYVEKLSARNATKLVSRPGIRLPLHATGVGLVLLAHSTEEFLNRFLSQELARYTPRTITNRDQIRARLSKIRSSGFVRVEEELHNGAISIAAGVRDGLGKTVAALSVVVPLEDRDKPALDTMVQWAAQGTSRILGYRK
jgi:DNA-binding IclR family transcriptional regulator